MYFELLGGRKKMIGSIKRQKKMFKFKNIVDSHNSDMARHI